MKALINLHNSVFGQISKSAPFILPSLARFTFAATLLVYYFLSGTLKIGDGFTGLFVPASGAYFQIFPKAIEAVGYDVTQLGVFHYLVVLAGTWAEFILPILIVIGLFTRLAALGMIGFVTMQTLTDLYGHGGIEHAKTLGAWFDRFPDGVILDQRLFWMFVLITLVMKGGGPLSVDRILSRRFQST